MKDYTDILPLKEQYMKKLRELETATDALEPLYNELAEKEKTYRMRKSITFLKHMTDGKTATAAKIYMDGDSADMRLHFKIAEGILKAAKENLKRLHSNVEACRTLISIAKAEINIR